MLAEIAVTGDFEQAFSNHTSHHDRDAERNAVRRTEAIPVAMTLPEIHGILPISRGCAAMGSTFRGDDDRSPTGALLDALVENQRMPVVG